MDDREIMELIAQGDERGMPELQRRYGALLRYVAAPVLGDSAAGLRLRFGGVSARFGKVRAV